MSKLKVLVSGAGMGGLCLAQALRRGGVDVEVFEREAHAGQRPQGYRLHIESDGADALRDALPPPLYALFEATAMRPRPFTAILDQDLVETRRIDVTCIVGGRHELLGVDDAAMRRASGPELCEVMLRFLSEWPQSTKAIVGSVDPLSAFSIEMHTSVPCSIPTSSNVTLLGDAIHAMSPTLGRGANMALRDAALIC